VNLQKITARDRSDNIESFRNYQNVVLFILLSFRNAEGYSVCEMRFINERFEVLTVVAMKITTVFYYTTSLIWYRFANLQNGRFPFIFTDRGISPKRQNIYLPIYMGSRLHMSRYYGVCTSVIASLENVNISGLFRNLHKLPSAVACKDCSSGRWRARVPFRDGFWGVYRTAMFQSISAAIYRLPLTSSFQ
jgi:hypothetical protein